MENIENIYKLFKTVKRICTDSRRIEQGSLFFALKGDKFDGNKYAADAISKGCVAAVVDDKDIATDERFYFVPDCLKALQDLAIMHRSNLKIPIIAITGTNGKTTTKELLAAVLSRKYRVSYTSGNRNNHIGVPLTILAMNSTVDMGIVEMGANHPGDIAELCEIAKPEYGIITNIGMAHLEGFGSLDGVKKTKAELYNYLEKTGGYIFQNIDNSILRSLVSTTEKLVTYGTDINAYCRGEFVDSSFCAGVNWTSFESNGFAKSNLVGEYNFENILAAICVGVFFEIPESAIDNAIASYSPRNNRSQLVDGTRNKIILDLYNANPTSMYAAINNFLRIADGNKCLILGDMLELGDYSYSEHKKLLDFVCEHDFRKVYLVGEIFYQFKDFYEFEFFKEVEQLAKHLIKNPDVGKFYLVKGSRGIRLEKCTDYL